jgi:hypothetical protein
VLQDEIWLGSSSNGPGAQSNATIVGWMADEYAACRAVVPSNFPLCAAALYGEYADPADVFRYTGIAKTCLDLSAEFCDFLTFHTFAASTYADTSGVRGAYPTKEIMLPSSILTTNTDPSMTAKFEAIFGLVNDHIEFRGMGYFCLQDILGGDTWGLFNSSSSGLNAVPTTERATKTALYRAGVAG